MAAYDYQNVKVEIRNGIAWTMLNRPEKRNAMSPALHYEIDQAVLRFGVHVERQRPFEQ